MKVGLLFTLSCVVSFVLLLTYFASFTASVYAAKATKSIQQGEGVKALNYIETAVRLSPKVSNYLVMKAEYLKLWINSNPSTRPILEPLISEELEKAVKLNPYYFRHYLRAANILSDLGYKDHAITTHEQAIKLVPNSSRLRNTLAIRYIHAKRYKDAEKQLQIAIHLTQQGPWSYESYYVAASLYEVQGNRENAVGALLKSIEIAPNSPLCGKIIQSLESLGYLISELPIKREMCRYNAS